MTKGQAKKFVADFLKIRSGVSDSLAVESVNVFPVWRVGLNVVVGDRFLFNGKIYTVINAHTTQADWTPDVAKSLFTEISITGGTLDNPIQYDCNMVLECGRYYTQNNIVYLCTRDTGISVYNPLAELVGLYVEVV